MASNFQIGDLEPIGLELSKLEIDILNELRSLEGVAGVYIAGECLFDCLLGTEPEGDLEVHVVVTESAAILDWCRRNLTMNVLEATKLDKAQKVFRTYIDLVLTSKRAILIRILCADDFPTESMESRATGAVLISRDVTKYFQSQALRIQVEWLGGNIRYLFTNRDCLPTIKYYADLPTDSPLLSRKVAHILRKKLEDCGYNCNMSTKEEPPF